MSSPSDTSAQRYGHAHLLDEFNIRLLIRDPVEFLKHGLLLEYKPLNLDVLPLYIALMIAFPPLLWVLRRWPNVALAISAGVYVAAQAWGWESTGVSRRPLVLQSVRVAILVRHRRVGRGRGARLRQGALIYSRTTLAAAGLFLLFAAIVSLAARTGSRGNDSRAPPIHVHSRTTRPHLAPYRVVHFLALAIVVSRLIPKEAPFLSAPWLRPLRLCGERSLEVFCVGIFLAFVAYFAIDLVSNALAFQIVVSIAGIGIMIAVAYFKTWTRDFRAASGRKALEREAIRQPRLAQRER
ncbi:OpgC domain-containing protein [Bradyrhizobium betae]